MKLLPSIAAIYLMCIVGCSHGHRHDYEHHVIHPKVFEFVMGWISEKEFPVVTELNLDAVRMNRNQFDQEKVVVEDGWVTYKQEGKGFLRYKKLGQSNGVLSIEYQENGGGSLTTSVIIGYSIFNKTIIVDGHSQEFQALAIVSVKSVAITGPVRKSGIHEAGPAKE